MAAKPLLVVVGNGMAAGRFLEEVLARRSREFEIIVFGLEPRVNYDRMMLSPVLSGEKRFEDILIHDDAWYARNGVTLRKGAEVVAIDRAAKRVVTRDGTEASGDTLVLATGSSPITIPVPGAGLDGVVTYRDLDDVHRMLASARHTGRAVVIGGGLLGLEAAAGLRMRGMEVTVLHLMPTLMERQLDNAAAAMLRTALEARGIDVLTEADTAAILGNDRVEGVRLKDGREIPADIVVMAIGIRPNVTLARGADLAVGRGIAVDDMMRTSDLDVTAIGECVEHRGTTYGLVAPLYEMAKVAAERIAGPGQLHFAGAVTATKLKVTGIDLFSAGDFADAPDGEEIVLQGRDLGVYRRLVLAEGRILGCVLYGDVADGSWFFDLMRTGARIGQDRDTLIFGGGLSPEAATPAGRSAGAPVRTAA